MLSNMDSLFNIADVFESLDKRQSGSDQVWVECDQLILFVIFLFPISISETVMAGKKTLGLFGREPA